MKIVMFQYVIIKWMLIFFLIAYTPRMLGWFAPFRKQKRLINDKKNKIALIIPARNEGKAVIPLFESIAKQTYGTENFDTYVVVKELDDPVHEYAKMIDATVYEDTTQTCKGDCLDYCIKTILANQPDEYDGYIVVDADCMLEPDFLEEMNHAMASGADVINAKKIVKNYYTNDQRDSNMVTACNGIIWTLIDEMGNRFKSDHGYTTMTISTGILFSKQLVKQWGGWIYKKTLTEDMELQRDCGVHHYKTFYYSYAKIYMEESPSHEMTNKRRNRWMSGLIASDRIYHAALSLKKDNYERKNYYYLYCLWIPYIFIGGLFALCCFNVFVAVVSSMFSSEISIGALKVAFRAFGLIYTAFLIMTLFAIVIDRKYIKLSFPRKVWLLLVHPLFYMEYIRIVKRAVLGKAPVVWEEIERVEANA